MLNKQLLPDVVSSIAHRHSHIPAPLKEKLAEGVKMIIPVGKSYVQKPVLLVKKKGTIHEKEIIHVRFVPMMGQDVRTY